MTFAPTPQQISEKARTLLRVMVVHFKDKPFRVFPVNKNAMCIALYMAGRHKKLTIVDSDAHAECALYDVLSDLTPTNPSLPCYALYKPTDAFTKDGVVFPWASTPTDVVRAQLSYLGEDPTRGGLLETPARVVKAWDEMYSGYTLDTDEQVKAILKCFEDGATGTDEMVLVTNIPVYSKCEHHMESIFGVAHIGYVPNGKIVGLSKLKRLVDVFARRLQVQERLTTQIADALDKHLEPQAVGVIIQAQHMCMEARGINVAGTKTTTSALRGAIKNEPDARAEFLQLIQLAGVKHG